tara:strand:+ start:3891 stop:4073 length:183 start_codon:yes stop_codon:yes gene_type:complete
MLDGKTISMIIIFVSVMCIFNIWRIMCICSEKHAAYERLPPPPYEEDSPPSYEQTTDNSE